LFASAVVAKVKNYFLPWEKTPAAEIDFPIQSKFARVNFVSTAQKYKFDARRRCQM
jgi:hypothetical protein